VLHFRVHGKGDKVRYIPVGLKAQRLITEYLEEAKHKDDLDGALFRPVKNNITKVLAKHLDPASVYQQIVKHYGAMVGINADVHGFCVHALRATAATNALKHFFDFCLDQQWVAGNPVKPSHCVRRGRPLPTALAGAQVQQLFAQIAHPMDRALFLVMLRCGLRVSEVAQLKLEQIDWEQQGLRILQGKGRKDRHVYRSPDLVASLHQCLEQHPGDRAQGYVFWNRKRTQQPLSVKAIQKKMERYAKAAGITASCHSLRHTFASNLLEHGAEGVVIRDFLGQSQIASSERYAKISRQKVKQEYMRTMQKILKQGQV
jgi:site-specific recombinase XerD